MKTNMGQLDKGIRLLLAGILAIVYFVAAIKGVVGIIIIAIAIIFAITSFVGVCPLYKIFGISSCPVKHPHHAPPPHKKHRK